MHNSCETTPPQEGYLWRGLFSQKHGVGEVTPANVRDWKFAYLLELNSSSVLGGLQCFHSGRRFNEAVLGFPLEMTINPKTKQVDYVYTNLDLLSADSFNVKVTYSHLLLHLTFTHFHSLSLTFTHFHSLSLTFTQLSTHSKSVQAAMAGSLHISSRLTSPKNTLNEGYLRLPTL